MQQSNLYVGHFPTDRVQTAQRVITAEADTTWQPSCHYWWRFKLASRCNWKGRLTVKWCTLSEFLCLNYSNSWRCSLLQVFYACYQRVHVVYMTGCTCTGATCLGSEKLGWGSLDRWGFFRCRSAAISISRLKSICTATKRRCSSFNLKPPRATIYRRGRNHAEQTRACRQRKKSKWFLSQNDYSVVFIHLLCS